MTGVLLERERELAALAASARGAVAGHGSVLLVSGEAGIGKSRLVQAARAHVPAECRVLVGHCDDLSTARTLGPFRDLVGGDRDRVLAALRAELGSSGRPTLLVIEDVHWADPATLDVLQYLVRRIGSLPVMLVLTYCDDELVAGHPARRLLGDAAAGGRHLPLRRLSRAAVRRISAGGAADAAEVYALTSGNPFLVAELLAAPGARVPPTVVAAVLARVRRLDPATRAAVEQLAVLPVPVERRLADRIVDGGLATLAAAEERGLLSVGPARLTFSHELTRRAVVESLPAARRMALHAAVLAMLVEQGNADAARIVHHAAEAGDQPAILRFGPPAARDAARRDAHQAAAAHYRLVLDHADAVPADELAGLLEGYAHECSTLGDHEQAVAAQERALELRRALGDPLAVGTGTGAIARMHLLAGHGLAVERAARAAVAALEPLDAPRQLAMAYSTLASVDGSPAGIASAERAVTLATGDAATSADAMTALASCAWDRGDPDGEERLVESLWIARGAGATAAACRASVTLVRGLLDRHRLTEAMAHAAAGIALARRREHLGAATELTVLRSRIQVGLGEWDDAVRSAADAVGAADPLARCGGFAVLGTVAARRGEPEAADHLAVALSLARSVGDPDRTRWVVAAAAEAAWLGGDPAAVVALAGEEAWAASPALGYWLNRAGHHGPVEDCDDPHGLLVAGRWRAAADRWAAAGDRYGHALALAESDDPSHLLAAVEELDALGARPLARITRQRLRGLGVTRVPRGPACASRSNPAGLTARQVEVLRLLTEDLTNPEIADRLVISVRTAANHVGAVLDKLGVGNRADAAKRGRTLLEARSLPVDRPGLPRGQHLLLLGAGEAEGRGAGRGLDRTA